MYTPSINTDHLEKCLEIHKNELSAGYATIYFAHHEISKLLRKYERHLIHYKRFIDDGNGLWNNHDDPDMHGIVSKWTLIILAA